MSKVSLVDGSWADADGAIWSVVETYIAVVSACLPTLRPLLGKCAGRGSSKGKSDPSYAMGKQGNGRSGASGSSMRKDDVEQRTVEADEETLVSRGADGFVGSGAKGF